MSFPTFPLYLTTQLMISAHIRRNETGIATNEPSEFVGFTHTHTIYVMVYHANLNNLAYKRIANQNAYHIGHHLI